MGDVIWFGWQPAARVHLWWCLWCWRFIDTDWRGMPT